MATLSTKQSDIKRSWWQVDADSEILGRMSTRIVTLLMGKEKTYYVPNLDCGDYVIVTNIEKVEVTGKKGSQKIYYRHSGFPGGFKQRTYDEQMKRDPQEVIMHAVKGMLPKNKLQADRLKRLKLFVGTAHSFEDKKPQKVTISVV